MTSVNFVSATSYLLCNNFGGRSYVCSSICLSISLSHHLGGREGREGEAETERERERVEYKERERERREVGREGETKNERASRLNKAIQDGFRQAFKRNALSCTRLDTISALARAWGLCYRSKKKLPT